MVSRELPDNVNPKALTTCCADDNMVPSKINITNELCATLAQTKLQHEASVVESNLEKKTLRGLGFRDGLSKSVFRDNNNRLPSCRSLPIQLVGSTRPTHIQLNVYKSFLS